MAVTYDSISVGVPKQRVSISPSRTGQINEERIGTAWRVANASNVPANVQLVCRFDVTNGRGILGVICKNLIYIY